MGRDELKQALNFIMNSADDGEFEVIVKAVQRRQKDNSLFSQFGGMRPEKMAKKMAGELQDGMNMEGIRQTVRGFVADIIRKEAPEISEEELQSLVGMYEQAGVRESSGKGKKGADLPPDAVASMVKQFMDYSTGAMSASDQQFLWESMPRWQDEYWNAFDPELKALIDGALKGKIEGEAFWTAVYSILGL
jgi:hypothetical protein